MQDQIEELASKAFDDLTKINDLKKLEEWRVGYLGRKSVIVQALRSLAALPIEDRRKVGARANELKNLFEDALANKKKDLEHFIHVDSSSLDVSLPGKQITLGNLHPTTQTIDEICNILTNMGFQIVEGPEVESDYYNFQALNMPEGHPARDMFATLWLDAPLKNEFGKMLLRTHTSPVQVRSMERLKPPIRIIAPGRVYRYEATDVTH